MRHCLEKGPQDRFQSTRDLEGGATKPGLFVVPVAGGEPRPLSLGDV